MDGNYTVGYTNIIGIIIGGAMNSVPERYEQAYQKYLNALASGLDLEKADEVFISTFNEIEWQEYEWIPGDIMERIPGEWAPVEDTQEPEWLATMDVNQSYMTARELSVDTYG